MEGFIFFFYNKYNGVNENFCFFLENLKFSGIFFLYMVLFFCWLELECNGKDLVFLFKILVYSE